MKNELINLINFRPIQFNYVGPVNDHGVWLSRYAIGPATFGSPAQYPNNKCYCPKGMKYKQCEGVYHIGLCYFGVPITVSNRHFLYASNYIQSQVIGINPDPELHESIMNIETVITFIN